MTHYQIPNEICIWKSQMKEFLDGSRKEVAIGINQDNYNGALYYIRKDAFIKKACEWLEDHIYEYIIMNRTMNEPDYDPKLIEDFRNYIKENNYDTNRKN